MGGLISDSNIKELLKDMGMTDYESEIYSILLENGVSTAKQVSELGDVPVTRVYETLKNMEKDGLISVLETRPKKYKIVSLDSLENLVEKKRRNLKREIDEVENTYKKIKNNISKLPNKDYNDKEMDERFWIIRERKAGLESENELIKKTENELRIFSGDLSWLPEQIDILKDLVEEGKDIKLLCHFHRTDDEKIEKLKKMDIEVKDWDNGYARGKIIDDKKTTIIFKVPREGVDEQAHTGVPGTEELFKYDRIITSNPKFVKMMRKYFNFFWNQDD